MQGVQLQDTRVMQRRMMSAQGGQMQTMGMGDGFDAIFAQMAASLQEVEDVTVLQNIQQQVDGLWSMGLLESADTEEKQTSTVQMLELAAAMLIESPQFLEFLQMDSLQATQLVSTLDIPEEAKQFVLNFRSELKSGGLLEQKSFTTVLEEGDTEILTDTSLQKVQVQENDSAQDDNMTFLDHSFMKNIREAKKLMDTTQKQTNTDTFELDIDQLQQDVASNRFNPVATVSDKAKQLSKLPQMSEQIQTGIAQNLLEGKKEFTIKLRPEGLGEITVKLVEQENGSTTLNLVASSAKTAELITRDLNALQNAMRPLQVEVQTVQTVAETQQAQQQQMNMDLQQQMAQQFSMAQQQSQQRNQNSNGFSSLLNGEADSEFVQEVEQQTALDGLDTYI